MAENPQYKSNGAPHETGAKEPAGRTWTEEFEMAGREVMKFLERLVHEGNVRRVIVKQGERVLFDIPLTLAAAGGVLTLWWAWPVALAGLVVGLAARLTVIVERVDKGEQPPAEPEGDGSIHKIEIEDDNG